MPVGPPRHGRRSSFLQYVSDLVSLSSRGRLLQELFLPCARLRWPDSPMMAFPCRCCSLAAMAVPPCSAAVRVLWLSRDSRLFPLQTIKSLQTAGNMLHLIEACILRKLIDTSAYLWPGYVVPSGTLKDTALPQESPWLNFMKVSRLSGPLIDALVASPASSSSSAR
uniref:Uncharacterized protein n=1 Tax=Zea mays TaxID=4577 RepID=A0A804UAM9_MAIZE